MFSRGRAGSLHDTNEGAQETTGARNQPLAQTAPALSAGTFNFRAGGSVMVKSGDGNGTVPRSEEHADAAENGVAIDSQALAGDSPRLPAPVETKETRAPSGGAPNATPSGRDGDKAASAEEPAAAGQSAAALPAASAVPADALSQPRVAAGTIEPGGSLPAAEDEPVPDDDTANPLDAQDNAIPVVRELARGHLRNRGGPDGGRGAGNKGPQYPVSSASAATVVLFRRRSYWW